MTWQTVKNSTLKALTILAVILAAFVVAETIVNSLWAVTFNNNLVLAIGVAVGYGVSQILGWLEENLF